MTSKTSRPDRPHPVVRRVAGAVLLASGVTLTAIAPAAAQFTTSQSGAAVAPRDSVLAVGDAFRLTVPGHPEFSGDLAVAADGTVDVPILGAVDAVGLEPSQLATRINTLLQDGYLRNPNATIAVAGAGTGQTGGDEAATDAPTVVAETPDPPVAMPAASVPPSVVVDDEPDAEPTSQRLGLADARQVLEGRTGQSLRQTPAPAVSAALRDAILKLPPNQLESAVTLVIAATTAVGDEAERTRMARAAQAAVTQVAVQNPGAVPTWYQRAVLEGIQIAAGQDIGGSAATMLDAEERDQGSYDPDETPVPTQRPVRAADLENLLVGIDDAPGRAAPQPPAASVPPAETPDPAPAAVEVAQAPEPPRPAPEPVIVSQPEPAAAPIALEPQPSRDGGQAGGIVGQVLGERETAAVAPEPAPPVEVASLPPEPAVPAQETKTQIALQSAGIVQQRYAAALSAIDAELTKPLARATPAELESAVRRIVTAMPADRLHDAVTLVGAVSNVVADQSVVQAVSVAAQDAVAQVAGLNPERIEPWKVGMIGQAIAIAARGGQ